MKAVLVSFIVVFSLMFGSCKNDKSASDELKMLEADSLAGDNEKTQKVPTPPTTQELAVSTSLMKRLMVGDSLSSFTRLIVTASLANDFMGGQNEFTVFAPVNQAFELVDQDSLNSLSLNRNQAQLQSLLKRHMVSGKIDAAKLSELYNGGTRTLETVSGISLKLRRSGGGFQLTDPEGNKARVIKVDIAASNGVLHLVDGVLGVPLK